MDLNKKDEHDGDLRSDREWTTSTETGSFSDASLERYLADQKSAEDGNEIQYRTCSLLKTSLILFSEYSCLAMVSFPWAYSVLGIIPGILITIFVSLSTLYTGLVLWEFCLRNPTVLDVCDIGQKLFWGSKIAWYFTAICFLLNNVFIMGLHLLTGAEWLNTVSNHPFCTIGMTAIILVVCLVASLPRTIAKLSGLAFVSTFTMFIAAILCVIFSAVESHPGEFTPANPVKWTLWPKKGTTFVEGMSAALNIVFTLVGQIVYPSIIAEMKDPRQFHIALKFLTVAEIVVYVIVGTVTYVYVGDAYVTAPAFGALQPVYKKIAFSFAMPTVVFLGVLYASISARFIFFRFFKDTRHITSNTVVGWASWTGILLVLWAIAFIIAEAIPIFSDLLSLMSSLFDSFFGYIFWGFAHLRMRQQDHGSFFWWRHKKSSPWQISLWFLNVFWIACGIYILGPGTYATVQSIVTAFQTGATTGAFTCADNGL